MKIALDPIGLDIGVVNTITNHGLEKMWKFEATHATTESKAAQDTCAMHRCMMSSLSKERSRRKERKADHDPEWLKLNFKPTNVKETRKKNNMTFYWGSDDSCGHCGGKWRCHKPSECDPNFYEKIKEKKRVSFTKKPEATKKKKSMDAMTTQVPEDSDSEE